MAEEKTPGKRGRPSTKPALAVEPDEVVSFELESELVGEFKSKVNTNFDAYEGDKPYLFVSYSHKDNDQVYPILNGLNDEKFRIWYDKTIENGSDFRPELRNKIEQCMGVLLFVSDNSLSSSYCGMEILVAFKEDKKIYPIYLKSDVQTPPALKHILDYLQHSNAEEKGTDGVIKELKKVLPPETMARLLYEADNTYLAKCEDNGKEIKVDPKVEVIGKNAFKDCRQVEKVELPESLVKINDEAFRACTSLREIIIPESTKIIGNNAFRDCTKLKKLSIKNELIKIGERAFENCSSLVEVDLPDGLRELYAGIFNGCKSLEKIKLPDELTVIGENAFVDCISLQEIRFTNDKETDHKPKIRKIDDFVFSGCTDMKEIELPEGLNKIGKAAFKNCTSLGEVRIPKTVSSLSYDAFRGCSNMRSIVVDKHNRYYKSEPSVKGGVNHVLFNKNKSVIIAYPASAIGEEYDIPDSVTYISDWTFSECRNLERISIPDSVEKIGEGAFSGCKNVNEFTIPDSVREIDDCAFRGCSNLKKISVPESVVDLGWGIFDGCAKELKVYCVEGSEIYKYCQDNHIETEKLVVVD